LAIVFVAYRLEHSHAWLTAVSWLAAWVIVVMWLLSGKSRAFPAPEEEHLKLVK